MARGSTNFGSINALDTASPSFPDSAWSWKIPLAWLVAIVLWWDRRYQYRKLLELDDRLLDDMGIARTAVEEARRSHLYMLAWRDSR